MASSVLPSIAFAGDATDHGVAIQFSAASNISVEVPSLYYCQIDMLLEWFDEILFMV